MKTIIDPITFLSINIITIFVFISISIMLKENHPKPMLYKTVAVLIAIITYSLCSYSPCNQEIKTLFMTGATIAIITTIINDYRTGFLIGIAEFGIIKATTTIL